MLRILSFILILFTIGCASQNCDTLPTTFNGYNEATKIVKGTEFTLSDDVNTSKSSWIRTAKYYSCDKEYGFLIIGTDKKEYLFQEVPIQVWIGFKQAGSFGKYYNNYIRGKYQLKLN